MIESDRKCFLICSSTDHDKELVLDTFVSFGVGQTLQGVQAVLDGLQCLLEERQLVFKAPQNPSLLLEDAL